MDETIEKQKGQLSSLFSHYYLDIQYIVFTFPPMLVNAVLDHNSNLTALAIIFQGYIHIFFLTIL